MNRVVWLGMALLLMMGCSAKQVVYETVSDVMPVCAPADAPYEIEVTLPDDARALSSTDEGCLYEAADGAYTIYTRVMVTDGLDAAVYALSGFAQPQLRLDSTDGEREACQFAWCSAGEQGQMVCRAKILREGDYYYALCFSLKEGLGGAYNQRINAVFSSFTLKERSQSVSAASEEAEVFPQSETDEIAVSHHVPAIVAVQHLHRRTGGDSLDDLT